MIHRGVSHVRKDLQSFLKKLQRWQQEERDGRQRGTAEVQEEIPGKRLVPICTGNLHVTAWIQAAAGNGGSGVHGRIPEMEEEKREGGRMRNSMISWSGVLCLLESIIMSSLFELQKAAGILLLAGIGLTVTAILLDGAEADRKREEKRQQKYRRRYQNDDMNDAV